MTPKRLFQIMSFSLILIVTLTIAVLPAGAAPAPALPEFDSFVAAVKSGEPGIARGLYVDDQFALKVAQQPKDNPAFVSTKPDILTEFRYARQQGNVGLLAHNYLAGQYFSQIEINQVIYVVFGDGKFEAFKVTNIYRYQAVSPESPYSDLIDLATAKKSNVETIFKRIYTGSHHLVLQTCINQDGNSSWGRLFIIAEPFTSSRAFGENALAR